MGEEVVAIGGVEESDDGDDGDDDEGVTLGRIICLENESLR